MKYFRLLSIFSLTMIFSTPAMAYIGFGPGMTFIGAFFSLVIGVVIILGMVLVLPVRMWLKRRKARKNISDNDAAPGS